MPSLQNPATVALLIGLAFGVLFGGYASRRVTRRFADSSGAASLVVVMSTLVVLIGAVPSCVFACVVGGNLGLLLGIQSFHPAATELIGMALGIGLVLSACVATCGAIGSGLGAALAPFMRNRQPSRHGRDGGLRGKLSSSAHAAAQTWNAHSTGGTSVRNPVR